MKSLKAKGGREIYSMLTTWQLRLSVLQPRNSICSFFAELLIVPLQPLLRLGSV